MKPNHKSSRGKPAAFVHYHNQYKNWLMLLSPFLKHVNMRTLALLMFLGVALLNTTDGKDAQTKEPAAGISNTEVVIDGRHESSLVAPLILWELTKRIAQAFTAAVNDPSLIEYAKQRGTDTRDLQTTPCRGAETKTSTY
jgi:hypothetical protein